MIIATKYPKWIRELSKETFEKYEIFLQRFDKNRKQEEAFYGNYRIPTMISRKFLEQKIKEATDPEEIAKELQGLRYRTYLKPKMISKNIKTKTKKGQELPIFKNIEKIINRKLTEKEKEVAFCLNKKFSGYSWTGEELASLFEDSNFQKDLQNFMPFDSFEFSKKIIEKEKESQRLFEKDIKARSLLAKMIREADLAELISFISKNKIFEPTKTGENFVDYLNRILQKTKEKNKLQSIEYILDSILFSLKNGWFPAKIIEIKTLEDLQEKINKFSEERILKKVLNKKSKKKILLEQKEISLSKKVREIRKKKKEKIKKFLEELESNSYRIEIPNWNFSSKIEFKFYFKRIFFELAKINYFSREARELMTTLFTFDFDFKKKSEIKCLSDIAQILKGNIKIFLKKFLMFP